MPSIETTESTLWGEGTRVLDVDFGEGVIQAKPGEPTSWMKIDLTESKPRLLVRVKFDRRPCGIREGESLYLDTAALTVLAGASITMYDADLTEAQRRTERAMTAFSKAMQDVDPDMTHCPICGDLIDSATLGCTREIDDDDPETICPNSTGTPEQRAVKAFDTITRLGSRFWTTLQGDPVALAFAEALARRIEASR